MLRPRLIGHPGVSLEGPTSDEGGQKEDVFAIYIFQAILGRACGDLDTHCISCDGNKGGSLRLSFLRSL